jgi:hypothetical protein
VKPLIFASSLTLVPKRVFSLSNFKFQDNLASNKMDAILAIWFPKKETESGELVVDQSACMKLWFQKNLDFDQKLRENFCADWQRAGFLN